MRRIPGVGLLAAVLAAGATVAACGSEGDEDRQAPAELRGQSFTSTSVIEGGEPRPLVAGTRLALTFKRQEAQDGVHWHAGCNTFGADVEIEAEKLLVGPISGTEIGCPRQRHQQDEGLADFFASDPRWRAGHGRLTLTAEEVVIELEARPRDE